MKAVILAAGRGSRLGRLTDDQPKCLVTVGGRSLLDWQLTALNAAGVDEIGIVCGYRRDALADRPHRLFAAPRWAETNMVTSLRAADEWLRAEPCVVSYGDIVYPAGAVRRLLRADGALTITYDPDWLSLWSRRFTEPLDDAETFRLAPDGSIAEIGATPTSPEEVEGQFMGLLRFTPESWRAVEHLVDRMPQAVRDSLQTTQLLSHLVAQGHRITAVPWPHGWGEVDSATDLDVYRELIDSGRLALTEERREQR